MTESPVPVVGFAGYSDSGKTTLAVRVVACLRRRGRRVAVVKHDAHGHYREAPGTDSARYIEEADADAVVVVSPGRTVRMEKTRSDASGLSRELEKLSGYDLIVVEGFKTDSHPKIVVVRTTGQAEAIDASAPPVIAVAAKKGERLPESAARHGSVPMLDIDDPESVAAFIERYFFEYSGGGRHKLK
ncbi:molybdopterin-guanine dinucleotide biosynthesis protein B [Paenibacillus flagellatus]|uniref:Molybdopterin-guanine dinucleotide biosynthesis protein B n=1 Tax=Paenibacillus flagellatus TaxID=2211139 RepID=A0A2V5KEE3_9BACL|nr:molybdopterin-guanine dinucleotide biosynthesis protein B [Paenibacillus flagellatus]PYI56463.1 molybdopterin-guanine dinucleotide biosynthesis protein B [Paenibacillus flagellatus]